MSPRTFAATAVIVIVFAASSAVSDGIYSGEPVSLELADVELETVLAHFSEISGFVFAVDPETAAQGILDQRVTVLYELTPWDQVVDEILADAGLAWTLEAKVLWIHLPGAAPTGDRNFTGDHIRLRLEDADVRDVLATFSKITDHAIELAPTVEGTVTLRLDAVPWDQVLDFILTINGLGYEFDGDVISVYPVTDARGRQLFVPPALGAPK